MKHEKQVYRFTGSASYFEHIVASNLKLTTLAVSEKQATNNIRHQVRNLIGLEPGCPISLNGKVVLDVRA